MQRTDLLRELREPSERMTGLSRLKTRYRPLVCPMHHLLELIPQGARVFEIGCGTGAFLYLALRLCSAELAHGCEVNARAVENSRAFMPHSSQFRVDLRSHDDGIPNLDGYDVVTLVDVLHHIPHGRQARILLEICEKLPDGTQMLLLDIDASRRLGTVLNQAHDLVLSHEWVHPWHPDRMLKTLNGAGMDASILEITRTLWYPHYLIRASRARARSN